MDCINMEYRIEHDSMGDINVPIDKYWGAQTQRSLEHFQIGVEKMPLALIQAFAYIKKAAAIVNHKLDKLDEEKLHYIKLACNEIIQGNLDAHFPLAVWQTGSGTQTNMNVNEVISNYANHLAGKVLIHPNDDANMSQSSNDTFPSAMHIATTMEIREKLLPTIQNLAETFIALEIANADVVKSGRTHLQDATPIAFSQEISGWRSSLEKCITLIEVSLLSLEELALGGTAVGTGLNAPKDFDVEITHVLHELTGHPFVPSKNKFHALTSKSELVTVHGALKSLACDMMKIANDIRWLASGPRCGLGEIRIPENEPGSSIMPGKVNPTQCESMTMIATQVIANDVAVGMSASQGNFELNVFMPVMIYNVLQSVKLLTEGIHSFHVNCCIGIKANVEKMHHNLHNSLMLATSLNPHIGYENAAKTVKLAHLEDISLKEACVKLGFLTAEEFDDVFHPETMI